VNKLDKVPAANNGELDRLGTRAQETPEDTLKTRVRRTTSLGNSSTTYDDQKTS